MSLQKRLAYLLVAFATFALVTTFWTIYGVRWHVESAIASLQRSMDEAAWIDRVRIETREQYVLLREIVDGERVADALYRAQRDGFFDRVRQVARFTLRGDREPEAQELLALTKQLRGEFERCLVLAQQEERDEARALLRNSVERRLFPALESHLRSARGALDGSRSRSVDELLASNTQVLILALLIGGFGIGLVTIGTTLVRRWVILPIRELHEATQQFSRANLAFRVRSRSRDELGELGRAMNGMAAGLADAQEDLRISEAKYRSLFENLRDATVICDEHGQVVEWHDGDTNLLGAVEPDSAGRHLLEVWPQWHGPRLDWSELISRVLLQAGHVRVPDLRLKRGGGAEPAIVDLIAYPVEFGDARHAALVLRDVTRQRQLERQARRTEAMEATVTFARGIAHDFNNLLSSAIAFISSARSETDGAGRAPRVDRALQACRQAAALARKLLSYGGGDPGKPQVLCLRETVELIMDSFDEEFLKGVRVHRDWNGTVPVKIDRDQLTQILLNLIRNAREAMPDGGELYVTVESGRLTGPAAPNEPPTHALLTVRDTGCGITPEIRDRLFEPFFTTKARGAHRSRGMGLAVVYAAVKNANGLLQVESEVGAGTTFRVCLPLEDRLVPESGFGAGLPD